MIKCIIIIEKSLIAIPIRTRNFLKFIYLFCRKMSPRIARHEINIVIMLLTLIYEQYMKILSRDALETKISVHL